jgi:3-oxoacyl-[acyl-carrier-protein] synthase II
MKPRPVITGLGIVSPIGIGVSPFWDAALQGTSGITHPTTFDASALPLECRCVGEISGFDVSPWLSPGQSPPVGRFSQFAVAAARLAQSDAGLPGRTLASLKRVKTAFATSAHGQADIAFAATHSYLEHSPIPPYSSTEYSAHAATGHAAIALNTTGQAMTLATACAGGIDSIAWAADQIATSNASVVLAGATDAPLSPLTLMVFRAAGVLARWSGPPPAASRPFEAYRSGLVLAEGAAAVVIEDEATARSRAAPIYARILGYASLTEGIDLYRTDRSGQAIAATITNALHAANIQSTDLDYVSAHGNSMRDYDLAETAGIKRALGPHAWSIPISSLKSMCGQALAASSAMQVVAACLTLKTARVHPTINYERPDPRCDLDYVPNYSRVVRARIVLVHAHGLGGTHSALILGSPD